MNFYFLCLVALITILSVKDVLKIPNNAVLILIGLVLLGMFLYRTKKEKFSISLRSRKSIIESLTRKKYQRLDQEKTNKKIKELFGRLLQ